MQCLFCQCVACDDERRRIQLLFKVRRPIQIELFKSDALFGGRERSVVCVFVSCCKNTQVNPVAAGALTGGLFKAGAGVRGAALASAIGAGLAAALHFQPGLR